MVEVGETEIADVSVVGMARVFSGALNWTVMSQSIFILKENIKNSTRKHCLYQQNLYWVDRDDDDGAVTACTDYTYSKVFSSLTF